MTINDETQKLIVVNDGCKSFVECPSLQDAQLYQELQNLDDEDDDLDEDEEESSDDEAVLEEQRGLIDEEAEAEQFNSAAAQ